MLDIAVKQSSMAENEDTRYPYVGVFNNGEVVLFWAKDTGMALSGGNNPQGHVASNWAERCAKTFTGKITICNKEQ